MCLEWIEFNLYKLLVAAVNGLTAAMLKVYTEAQQPWWRVTNVYPCGQCVRNSQNANKGPESLLLIALFTLKIRLSV